MDDKTYPVPSPLHHNLANEMGWEIIGWDAERPPGHKHMMLLSRGGTLNRAHSSNKREWFVHLPTEIPFAQMRKELGAASFRELVRDAAEGDSDLAPLAEKSTKG